MGAGTTIYTRSSTGPSQALKGWVWSPNLQGRPLSGEHLLRQDTPNPSPFSTQPPSSHPQAPGHLLGVARGLGRSSEQVQKPHLPTTPQPALLSGLPQPLRDMGPHSVLLPMLPRALTSDLRCTEPAESQTPRFGLPWAAPEALQAPGEHTGAAPLSQGCPPIPTPRVALAPAPETQSIMTLPCFACRSLTSGLLPWLGITTGWPLGRGAVIPPSRGH